MLFRAAAYRLGWNAFSRVVETDLGIGRMILVEHLNSGFYRYASLLVCAIGMLLMLQLRNFVWPMQVISYNAGGNNAPCYDQKYNGTRSIMDDSVNCWPGDQLFDVCSYVVVVAPAYRAIVVTLKTALVGYFRDFSDIVIDDNVTMVDWPGGGKVNANVSTAFMNLWNNNNGLLGRVVYGQLEINKGYDVWVTGYGAVSVLANLFSEYLVIRNTITSDRILEVTFGSPRPGDADFAAAHNLLVPHSFRITQPAFPMVKYPKGNWKHHGTEIYYPRGSNLENFRICHGNEDPMCSINNVDRP